MSKKKTGNSQTAIALYPDMGTYSRIRSIREDDDADAMDAFMSTHQLQLVFCRAAELMKGERAAIKASGVKFPRGVNPSFVSYVAGFAPDAMGAGEMRETPDDRKTDWAPIFDFVLETMLKGGFRPERIATNNAQIGAILGNLCAHEIKGTEFVPHAPCPAAHAVFDMISSRMFYR